MKRELSITYAFESEAEMNAFAEMAEAWYRQRCEEHYMATLAKKRALTNGLCEKCSEKETCRGIPVQCGKGKARIKELMREASSDDLDRISLAECKALAERAH